ncbi:hypothetical protein E2C01_008113 [Portunus trituberculatus]|uniref:Uncharacterized protein n=1 Tax=Portunus trituberculatus TaxID=210409 RepID=A0A5B7CZY7_PORTR|nr:hypothetical protein [Portunus trituberculatus]
MEQLLRKQYDNVFSAPMDHTVIQDPDTSFQADSALADIQVLTDTEMNVEDISIAINKLKINSATGSDGLTVKLLKVCKDELSLP